jgi:hypothetical protein
VSGIFNINPEVRVQLQRALQNYYANLVFISRIPREANRAKLIRIKNLAQDLIDCLETLDEKSQQLLLLAGYWVGSCWDKNKKVQEQYERLARGVLEKYGAENEIKDLFREPDIYKLLPAAEKALKMVKKDKGGRPRGKSPLREFIRDLKPIFEEMTNEKATCPWSREAKEYKSQFLKFVFACLKIIDPEATESLTNNSLGQQVRIVLSRAKFAPHS